MAISKLYPFILYIYSLYVEFWHLWNTYTEVARYQTIEAILGLNDKWRSFCRPRIIQKKPRWYHYVPRVLEYESTWIPILIPKVDLVCVIVFIKYIFNHSLFCHFRLTLTHWGRGKMDAISQTTFSRAIYSMKIVSFWLNFHLNIFARVYLTIIQPDRRQAIIWTNDD